MHELSWSTFLQIIFLFAPFLSPLKVSFESDATVNIEQVMCYFQVLYHMHSQSICFGLTVGCQAGAHYTLLVFEIM